MSVTEDLAFPELQLLHERHYGITPEVGAGLCTADYFVGAPGQPDPLDVDLDFENAYRLEVSGIDRCEAPAVLAYRLRQKVEQTHRGRSIVPALAGVVAFDLLRIAFALAS